MHGEHGEQGDPGAGRAEGGREVGFRSSVAHPEWDLAPLLTGWEYAPDEIVARRFVGRDGREKLQMRLEMGLLQMDADGRPDGEQPHGAESLFDHYARLLEDHVRDHGVPGGFVLAPEDCAALRDEATLYYHRYLCLFCVGDFGRMERDTARNLRLFDFVNRYAGAGSDRYALEPYRAYVIMMNTRAKAGMAAEEGRCAHALRLIEDGIRSIEEVLIGRGDAEEVHGSAEIASLRELADEVRKARPRTLAAEVEAQLEQAVSREDYVAAARLRDMLASLQERGHGKAAER